MTEVAERSPQVPALATTPALQLDLDDIVKPRLYIGQFMSKAVQDQLVKPGSLFAASGADDPDPEVLWELSAKPKPGVLVYVLTLRKGKSKSEGGELLLFEFDDPSAPADASVTYNYTLAIPEVDADLPFQWLATRTSTPAAKKINTILAKNSISGPPWATAFRLSSAARENDKGKYFIAQVSPVDADPSHSAAVELLASRAATTPAPAPRSNQPAI